MLDATIDISVSGELSRAGSFTLRGQYRDDNSRLVIPAPLRTPKYKESPHRPEVFSALAAPAFPRRLFYQERERQGYPERDQYHASYRISMNPSFFRLGCCEGAGEPLVELSMKDQKQIIIMKTGGVPPSASFSVYKYKKSPAAVCRAFLCAAALSI